LAHETNQHSLPGQVLADTEKSMKELFALPVMKSYIVALSFLAVTGITVHAERPNIVLIMADDLGLGDVSHHVRTQMKKEPVFETLAIDALARESLWFTDGHSATSLCSPTRYCVMSGNNNYRSNAPWGVWGTFRETAFKQGEVTLGTVVKDAGYSTGFIGKWHLGGDFRDLMTGGIYRSNDRNSDLAGKVDLSRCIGNGPSDWGFDYDFTLPCGIQGPIYTAYENDAWYRLADDSKIVFLDENNAVHPKDLTSKGNGMGDSAWDAREIGKLISSKAVDFIDATAGKGKPFFLYYCSPMCHVPHCPPDEFDGKKINGATPSRHLDMVLDLDQQVNRIVNALKANGEYDNTLIVFTSDNGGLMVDKETAASGHETSGGFAGSKNSPLEGGHRTPFFAVWKDHIHPGVTEEPAINQDMVATFAALVGTKIPEDQAQDSNNLLSLLTGQGKFQQREFIVQQAGSKKELMYRKWPWKLILQSDHKLTKFEPIALFNLQVNPTEKEKFNLVDAPEHNARVYQMRSEYLEIFNSRQRTAPSNPVSEVTKQAVKKAD
jgi:arylsulfatase A